jgi:HAMP domain-containing protein
MEAQASHASTRRQGEREPLPAQTLRPRTASAVRRNIFLDLPIAGRLALGFVIAALVAGLAAGIVGLERSQSLSKQTDFYHHLLQVNTSLTTGRSFLELMSSKLQQTVDDANTATPSHETLAADDAALNNLARLYSQTLNNYVQQDLLDQHSDQMALLNEANEGSLAQQQRTLTSSTQRTWQFYQGAQQEIVGYLSGTRITLTDVKNAQLVLQQQAEPTNADALSALHSLIQLNDRLASAVDNATNVEIHNELITTLLATGGAFILIALVGWFISDTLVRRLRHLQRVTRAVGEGRINERVQVAGRDEIAEVSLAVNAMVDTIVGLLEETRQQRDALTGAAEHLFSDMRIVNAGDLRISATVSNDPIGMLANAFNFTVGRFRRFLLRTQTSVEQLDVVARQSQERSSSFISMVRVQLRDISTPRPPLSSTGALGRSVVGGARASAALRKEMLEAQDALLLTARNDLDARMKATRETLDRASQALGRLNELISTPGNGVAPATAQAQLRELTTLEQLLHRLSREVRQVQQNTTGNFTRLADALAAYPASTSGEAQEVESVGAQSISEAQYQEFARQAGSFAVEVNALSRRLAAIVQEMRSGIVPFHLEGGSAGENFRNPSDGLDPDPFAASPAGSTNW